MTQNYKLNEEIKQFIINQKKADPKVSCRGMSVLIKEHFKLDLSKSLINNIIKQGNLSSPVGRRRVRFVEVIKEAPKEVVEKALPEVPKETPKEPIKEPVVEAIKEAPVVKEFTEPKTINQEADFMENGGFFFLKAADLKLNLTSRISELLLPHFPGLPQQTHQAILETFIFAPFFKDKRNLGLLLGKEVTQDNLMQYEQQLIQVPLPQIKELMAKVGIDYNSNDINELQRKCISRLNSFIVHYFPPEYQSLDFPAMKERFYFLPGSLQKKDSLISIQLFYPKNFFGVNDMIWQEGFSFAANTVNKAKILTPQNEQIWISPQVNFS